MRPRELLAQVASYYPTPYEVDVGHQAPVARRPARTARTASCPAARSARCSSRWRSCGRPELLFLDEPTVGLDVQAREALWKVVRELLHEGCSIVLTTHYLEEAEALADRVAVMARGRLDHQRQRRRDPRARVAQDR